MARGRIRIESAQQHPPQPRRDPRRGGQRPLRQHLLVQGEWRPSRERPLAVQTFPDRHAEGELIAGGGGLEARHHFGSEVSRRAGDPSGVRVARTWFRRGLAGRIGLLHLASESEVADHHPAVVRDEDVIGLEVAVEQASLVRRRQTSSGGEETGDDGVGGTRRLAQPFAQGAPFDQLHGDEGARAVLADVVDVDHVAVHQPRHGPGFAPQPILPLRLPGPRRALVDELDGDAAVELRIPGRVDHPHRARPEHLADQIAADERSAADGKIELERAQTPLAGFFGLRARGGGLRRGGEELPAIGAPVEMDVGRLGLIAVQPSRGELENGVVGQMCSNRHRGASRPLVRRAAGPSVMDP